MPGMRKTPLSPGGVRVFFINKYISYPPPLFLSSTSSKNNTLPYIVAESGVETLPFFSMTYLSLGGGNTFRNVLKRTPPPLS